VRRPIDTLLLAPEAVADMTDDSEPTGGGSEPSGDGPEPAGGGFEPSGDDAIAGLSRSDPLAAVSPLDGRYAGRTAPLSTYASEAGLMRARTRVEVEYLIALAALDATPIAFDEATEAALRGVYEEFSAEDARLIKSLETEGAAGYDATNHDVKSVEYFLRIRLSEIADEPDAPLDGAESLYPWIHFGLTSEDANNLAHRLLVKRAVSEVVVPAAREVRDALVELAHDHRDTQMLARTHGQPATPTTFGKEMAVYAARLGRALGRVVVANGDLSGKLAGASGTFAAHRAAYPGVDWRAFSESFVRGLDLEHTALATQVNPCDDLAALFDALRGVNNVLLDLDLDAWLYVSDRYLGQEAVEGETGSSTMPHKVNPIDFENSEGNLSKANADLTFLADYVTTSRLQRDLSDSTVKRNVGAALAHCLIGYSKAADGLEKVVPNEAVMREELDATPEVIGEAVQTILRREGDTEAYERVKALSRGRSVTLDDFRELFDDLDVDDEVREELKALTPTGYTGVADELVDELDE
jgi:adenylosuccinate lyase